MGREPLATPALAWAEAGMLRRREVAPPATERPAIFKKSLRKSCKVPPRVEQAAEKLVGAVGPGFIPGMNQAASTRALHARKNSCQARNASGHDFSRAVN